MNKDEILEKNKKSNTDEEDEREQYISVKAAGIYAKFIFSLLTLAMMLFKYYKGIPTGDIVGIFMAYLATESFYKYYHLRYKKLLLFSVFFSISSVSYLLQFIIST
ncbi:MAG: DUF6442 family protein [Clostridium beijerinckii]